MKALTDLNFLEVKFEIQVRHKEEYAANGYDDVEFMISTNPGEPMKSLGSVASGGELSRIMLAIKTVLASRDRIPTMIFDEIDTGISGKTAWKVSREIRCFVQKSPDYLHYTFTADSSHGRCTLQNSQTGSKSENRDRNHPSATRRSCGRIGKNARRRDDYRYCQRECQELLHTAALKKEV